MKFFLLLLLFYPIKTGELVGNYNYLYFPRLNYKNNVIKGDFKANLDTNNLCLNKYSNNKHLVISGHNNDYSFRIIKRLILGDIININLDGKDYIFKVKKIRVVSKNYKLRIYNKKRLTLITCTNHSKDRYIIEAY